MKNKPGRQNTDQQLETVTVPPNLVHGDANITAELKKKAAEGDSDAEAALAQYASTTQ